MKKLLLLIAASALHLHGQGMLKSINNETHPSVGCTEATDFLARTSGLDATHQSRYTTLICGLVTDSVWTKLDALYIFATADTTTAALSLVNATYNLTITGSFTFAADTGWTGDGGTTYMNTNFNPSTAGGQYARNSASVGAYVRTSRSSSAAYGELGLNDNVVSLIRMLPLFSGDLYYCALNGFQTTIANTNAQGSWIQSRTSSSLVTLYKNGSSFGTASDTSTALINGNIYVFAENILGVGPQLYSEDQLSATFIGSSLSSTDASNISSRINTYMTAYGVNVY